MVHNHNKPLNKRGKIMKTTLKTTINTKNDFSVTINHFGMPAQANVPIFALLGALDSIQEHYEWTDTNYNGFSPKCLVADMCCYMTKNKIVQHFINNATIKAGLRNENVKFVADLCCYAHCAGAIMGNEIQDAMWSIFNAIKNYICDNWNKENSNAFFCNID